MQKIAYLILSLATVSLPGQSTPPTDTPSQDKTTLKQPGRPAGTPGVAAPAAKAPAVTSPAGNGSSGIRPSMMDVLKKRNLGGAAVHTAVPALPQYSVPVVRVLPTVAIADFEVPSTAFNSSDTTGKLASLLLQVQFLTDGASSLKLDPISTADYVITGSVQIRVPFLFVESILKRRSTGEIIQKHVTAARLDEASDPVPEASLKPAMEDLAVLLIKDVSRLK